tara:strand:+ start:1713 stop:1856 length:144 start_codon:yes stop_codon:yes gene_type:complete
MGRPFFICLFLLVNPILEKRKREKNPKSKNAKKSKNANPKKIQKCKS